MTFSVIVAWRESAELLRRCLDALEGQGADHILVLRSSTAEFSEGLQQQFPHVGWLGPFEVADLPELYWSALPSVPGDIVATLEAPAIPEPHWVEHLRQAHLARPEALACGGPVRSPVGGSTFDLGWYWSEFAAYSPGRAGGPTTDLTDANVTYKRSLLVEHRAMLDACAWGWRIRKAPGRTSYFEPRAIIEFPNPSPPRFALRERFRLGRAHAAQSGRWAAAIAAPLLPFVLSWRGWRAASRSGAGRSYVRALPAIICFHVCWAVGELSALVATPIRR